MYKVGDKFEIEIAELMDIDNDLGDSAQFYRVKGMECFILNDNMLNKLKKIEAEATPRKTVKASELPIDTKVLCWTNIERDKQIRYFAGLLNGRLYAYYDGCNSSTGGSDLIRWGHMTLEDGTVVLSE